MATFTDPVHDEFASWFLGLAPYGGADVGEIDALVPLVKDGDDGSFYEACAATATARIAEGDSAAKSGHLESAYDCYLRAALFLAVGIHPLYGTPVDPRLRDGFHLGMATFEKALRLGVVRAEPVDIPYGSTKIPAWFLRAPGHEDERRACILVGGGWDSTMIENFLGMGAAALRRGYHVLLHDGPGQGSLLVDEGLTLRHDWEQVVTPVVDAALGIDVVDPDQLVYEPWSLGGFMAPRVAAYEHRLAAVIADPGQMDVGGKITGPLRMLGLDAAAIAKLPELSASDEKAIMDFFDGNRPLHWKIVQRGFWTNRGGDLSGFIAEMMKWKLTPEEIAGITTPMLVTAAQSDPVSSDSKALYDALPGPKTFLQFTDAEGAGMHCEILNRSMANRRILDWVDDTLATVRSAQTSG
jgi:alpha-beta hydrolase superfamily lysophospholipase